MLMQMAGVKKAEDSIRESREGRENSRTLMNSQADMCIFLGASIIRVCPAAVICQVASRLFRLSLANLSDVYSYLGSYCLSRAKTDSHIIRSFVSYFVFVSQFVST